MTELKCGLLKLAVKEQIGCCPCIGSGVPLTGTFEGNHMQAQKNDIELPKGYEINYTNGEI